MPAQGWEWVGEEGALWKNLCLWLSAGISVTQERCVCSSVGFRQTQLGLCFEGKASPYQVDVAGLYVPEEDVGHPFGVPPHAGVIWEIPGRKKHNLETISNPVQASPGTPVGVGDRGEAAASGGNRTRSGGFGSWPGEGADISETRLCP